MAYQFQKKIRGLYSFFQGKELFQPSALFAKINMKMKKSFSHILFHYLKIKRSSSFLLFIQANHNKTGVLFFMD